jgi:hypothetical protein
MVVHSQSIGFFLNSLKELEAISVHARRLIALQQAFAAVVPKDLARWAMVGYERKGTVVLLAANGAVAAKLRQMTPRILAALKQQRFDITAMRVEVQVAQRSTSLRAPRRRIGATGLAQLSELSRTVSDPRLRTALRRLVRGQRELDGQDQPLEREQRESDQHED